MEPNADMLLFLHYGLDKGFGLVISRLANGADKLHHF